MEKTIIDLLQQGKVNIQFTKADGTHRTMLATRDLTLIPADKQTKDDVDVYQEVIDLNYVPVFDLEIGEWRAFRKERLISYEPA